jgi:hypothetical protein
MSAAAHDSRAKLMREAVTLRQMKLAIAKVGSPILGAGEI